MRLWIFDDAAADGWHPFALTRPVSELLFGARTLRERLERFAGAATTGLLTRSWLDGFRETEAPPARSRAAGPGVGEDRDVLLLCSRFVPEDGDRWSAHEPPATPAVLRSRGGEVAGAWLPAGAPQPGPEWLRAPGALDAARDRAVGGHLVAEAWQIVAEGTERLRADLESDAGATGPSPVPDGCHLLGDGALLLGHDVRIEPGVVFDTREGPVRLDEGVEVRTGSRLQGPLWAGPRTRFLGGTFTALAAGPRCTLRGEIEESIVLGYANKAHDGFLGHSVVGRWVNLGALTTNSDLKNNYGPIRVGGPGGERETGLLKLGCLIGDHAKTAIGTRLNAGTVVGAGANLFGDGVPPRWVQPFAWGNRPDAPPYERERFLDTAARVMARRDVGLGEAGRGWLGACWDAARGTPER